MDEKEIQEAEKDANLAVQTIDAAYDIMKDTLIHLSVMKGVNYQTAAADALARVQRLEADAQAVALGALGALHGMFDSLPGRESQVEDDDMDEPLGERQEDADAEECTSCQ